MRAIFYSARKKPKSGTKSSGCPNQAQTARRAFIRVNCDDVTKPDERELLGRGGGRHVLGTTQPLIDVRSNTDSDVRVTRASRSRTGTRINCDTLGLLKCEGNSAWRLRKSNSVTPRQK